jgi:uncharacterized protein YkwD
VRQPKLSIAAAILGASLLVALSPVTATAATATPILRHHPTAHRHGACRSARSSRQHRKLHSRCRARGRGRKQTAIRRSYPSPTVSGQRAAALARASMLASVLATPCQNTQLMPEPANLEVVRAAVLCLINRERAQNGETPLVRNSRLEQAAESHGSEMISLDYFQHVSPSGETPVERVRGTGYIPGHQVGYVIGENLAWGTLGLATPQAVVEAWIASPKHLANILEGQYRETGIGVTPQVPASLSGGQPGATYSQEFGVIIR